MNTEPEKKAVRLGDRVAEQVTGGARHAAGSATSDRCPFCRSTHTVQTTAYYAYLCLDCGESWGGESNAVID